MFRITVTLGEKSPFWWTYLPDLPMSHYCLQQYYPDIKHCCNTDSFNVQDYTLLQNPWMEICTNVSRQIVHTSSSLGLQCGTFELNNPLQFPSVVTHFKPFLYHLQCHALKSVLHLTWRLWGNSLVQIFCQYEWESSILQLSAIHNPQHLYLLWSIIFLSGMLSNCDYMI